MPQASGANRAQWADMSLVESGRRAKMSMASHRCSFSSFSSANTCSDHFSKATRISGK